MPGEEVRWDDLGAATNRYGDAAHSRESLTSTRFRHGVSSAEWIRRLGKMMVKFDFKGFSKAKGRVPIGEGDEGWPEVLEALGEIGYDGWATSEVSGPPRRVNSGESELADIAARMNRVLGVG